MSQSIVYYITGHGFGHARRAAAVIRRLRERRPDVRVVVRTSASEGLFEDLQVEVHKTDMDPGAVEDDPLTINPERTRERVGKCLGEKRGLVETEVLDIPKDTALIATDATFLAGEVAEKAGVPCVAVTNFTWDWIYEPFLGQDMVEEIQASYRKMAGILKLPFGGRVEMFAKVVQVPLIVNPAGELREKVLEKMGLDPGDRRPRVLVGQRGGIPPQTLLQTLPKTPQVVYLAPQEPPLNAPENLRAIRTGRELSFSDVLRACDVVVSKLGYGTVADCIAAQTRLLWPARSGFREDEVMAREMTPFLRHREIGREDFVAGRWGEAVMGLLEDRREVERPAVNGDVECARLLEEWL